MHASRAYLRQTTGPAHRRLDTLMADLKLDVREDYVCFLNIHAMALRGISEVAGDVLPLNLGRLIGLLDRDLGVLGLSAPQATQPGVLPEGGRLGVLYVLAGSHFGASLLHNVWSQNRSPDMAAAGSYLRAADYKQAWPTTLERLKGASQADLDRARRGALWTFEAFEDAARDALVAHQDAVAETYARLRTG